MHSYVEGLKAILLKSQERGDKEDVILSASFHDLKVDYVTYRPCHLDLLH